MINKARWYFNGHFAFYQRQLNLSIERRIALRERFVRELVEFFSNYKGKLFGTAAWRRMIGKPESLVTLFFFYILCSLLTSDRNVSPDIRTPGEVLHYENENIQYWSTYKFFTLISWHFPYRISCENLTKDQEYSLWILLICLLIVYWSNWEKIIDVGHP